MKVTEDLLESGQTELPNGCTLYWGRDLATGARTYASDEVGGGVRVWDCAVVDSNTLLTAITTEAALCTFERHQKKEST